MGWWLTAKPGDRIVCVDDAWPADVLAAIRHYSVTLPVKGKIYTVRQIGFSELKQHWALRMVEIVNDRLQVEGYEFGEPTFGVARFRPLIKRPTDIAIFTAMLAGRPLEVQA